VSRYSSYFETEIAEQGIEIKPFLGFMVKDEKVVLEDVS